MTPNDSNRRGDDHPDRPVVRRGAAAPLRAPADPAPPDASPSDAEPGISPATIDGLRGYAAALLRQRRGQAGFDPDSIVLSVLADELPKLRAGALEGDHRSRHLRRAVRNRMIDRTRRKAAGPLQEEPADPASAPQSHAPTGHADGMSSIRAVLRTAAGDGRLADLVEMAVLRGHPWAEAAEHAGTTPGAARVQFHRARQRLLGAVLAPVLARLDAPAAETLQALLLDRIKPDARAEAVGLDEDALSRIFQARCLPALLHEYGPEGMAAILRLAGIAADAR